MIIGAFEKIQSSKKFMDISFGPVEAADVVLEGKNFDNCSMSYSKFTHTHFKDCTFHMCFLDFSQFEKCQFEDCRITLSIFACSVFNECTFSECDLISVNFNGINMIGGGIKESDLYYSRFVKSDLRNSLFYDCNLKRVDFSHSHREDCSFKSCNIQDAYMETNKE